MMLTVREMTPKDISLVVDYFTNATPEYIHGMGAVKSKLPSRKEWIKLLENQLTKAYDKKEFYYIIWLIDNEPVGHSNINQITYNEVATMHLHVWHPLKRQKGLGKTFLKKTIPYYFKNFELEKLLCEPYSKNIPPNKTLPKVGFKFIRAYETIPGWINFHQTVNRFEFLKTDLEKL